MKGGGRSDEDTAGNCNGWNETLAESKTNRVVFHDRKDRSERGNEEARDRRGVLRGRRWEKTTCINDMMDGGRGLRLPCLRRNAREKEREEENACIHLTPTRRAAFRNDTTPP